MNMRPNDVYKKIDEQKNIRLHLLKNSVTLQLIYIYLEYTCELCEGGCGSCLMAVTVWTLVKIKKTRVSTLETKLRDKRYIQIEIQVYYVASRTNSIVQLLQTSLLLTVNYCLV